VTLAKRQGTAVRRTVVVRWRAAIPMCEAVEGVVLGGVSGDERGTVLATRGQGSGVRGPQTLT